MLEDTSTAVPAPRRAMPGQYVWSRTASSCAVVGVVVLAHVFVVILGYSSSEGRSV
jgi:hypothetical protein